MNPTKKLWTWLGIVFVLSFAALGSLGHETYLAAPPYPEVRTTAGDRIYSAAEIREGQRAWLAAGGQRLGTVRGHGSYVAPDWSADWLHREALALREMRAEGMYGRPYGELQPSQRAAVDQMVKDEMRRDTYDAGTNTVTVSAERAVAIAEVQRHYSFLFGEAPGFEELRAKYAMGTNVLPRAADRKALAGFFFWSAWAAATDRPGESRLAVGGTKPAAGDD